MYAICKLGIFPNSTHLQYNDLYSDIFLKGKEKLQFQRIFLEIFGLLRSRDRVENVHFSLQLLNKKYKIYFYNYSKL